MAFDVGKSSDWLCSRCVVCVFYRFDTLRMKPFAFTYAVCHVPVVCGGRPSPLSPMSLEYINRFPANLAMVFRNRPLSLSLRSLNRNACSRSEEHTSEL